METLYSGIVAVGEQGLVVHDGFPIWYGSHGARYPELLTVTVEDGEYLAAGKEGVLFNREHSLSDCRITDEDIMDFIPKAVWYLESFDEDCISGIISNYFVAKMAKGYTDEVGPFGAYLPVLTDRS